MRFEWKRLGKLAQGLLLGGLIYLLVCLAGLAFTWFTSYWNLLGYKL